MNAEKSPVNHNVDHKEIAKFEAVASRWWDLEGEFKPLHRINPLRLGYIAERSGGLFGKKVLDVGCGSGILAVCGVLLGASHADGVDIDELAAKIAGENAVLNGVEDRTHFVQGDLTDKISGQYDVICANIVADVIIRLCPSIRQFLKPNGYFLASGIIDERSVEVQKAILNCGMQIVDRREEAGWVALRCRFAEE